MGFIEQFATVVELPAKSPPINIGDSSSALAQFLPCAMFAAASFDTFTVADPVAYADQVWSLDADAVPRLYYRLTPTIYAALRQRLDAAHAAYATGNLDPARLAAAVDRFQPLAEWASDPSRAALIQAALATRTLLPLPDIAWEAIGVGATFAEQCDLTELVRRTEARI